MALKRSDRCCGQDVQIFGYKYRYTDGMFYERQLRMDGPDGRTDCGIPGLVEPGILDFSFRTSGWGQAIQRSSAFRCRWRL